MERLIDATRIEQYILNNCSDNEEINAIYAEIINAPTVDAVPLEDFQSMERTVNKLRMALADAEPVVRCKDCKHGEEENETEWIGGPAPFYCGFRGGLFDGDWYCADGERRENDRAL